MRGGVLFGAAFVAVLGIGLAGPATTLVISDEDGAVRWRLPVGDGTTVVLQYTNSIYLAPTWERFVVRAGRLHLVDVSSTREAVLEYHRLAPPYRYEEGRVVASVSGVALDGYALRIGARGRPTLRVGDSVLPLYQAGTGAGLRLAVRRVPRLLAWLRG
jgi:hypothetical protein